MAASKDARRAKVERSARRIDKKCEQNRAVLGARLKPDRVGRGGGGPLTSGPGSHTTESLRVGVREGTARAGSIHTMPARSVLFQSATAATKFCTYIFTTLLLLTFFACSTPGTGADAQDSAPVDQSAADTPPDEAADGCPAWRLQVDAGHFTTDDAGRTAAFGVQIPMGASSVVATFSSAKHQIQVAQWTGGAGDLVVPKTWLQDADAPWLCAACQNRVRAQPQAAAFLLPNSPQLVLHPGENTLSAFAFDYDAAAGTIKGASASVAVSLDIVCKTPEQKKAGAIDINLCLSGTKGITATNASQHPLIVQMFADVKDILAQAGIEIAHFRLFDMAQTTLIVKHDNGLDLEIASLFLGAPALPPGINVFLVDAIMVDTGAAPVTIAGLSGGIPGPPSGLIARQPGPRSGVVLATNAGQDLIGKVMAHEICHYLGLFHTTEADPPTGQPLHDAIPDTPETGDDTNLMYFKTSQAASKLTPQQAAVLQANPAVIPFSE